MVSSFDLKAAELRLKKEQNQRVEREKHKLEKERILKERQRQREQEREEERARRRLEETAVEQAAAAERESIINNNRGVYYQETLQAMPLDEALIASKGIKKFTDKVMLPASAGASLMAQDAPKNGPMLFHIKTAAGTSTHAGLLDFTMAEDCVALPRKVVDCLWGRGQQPRGQVTVTYKYLEKGQFVRFQPLTRGFHEEVGDKMRDVLEQAVLGCCTLTEGDLLRVVIGDGDAEIIYGLRVQELRPDPAVCCMDIDMEAEVMPSEETERALKEMEEISRRLREEEGQRQEIARQALEAAQEAEAENERYAAQKAADRERIRQGLEASLPMEPGEANGKPQLLAVFRMPDGSRCKRRFLLEQPASLLFTFADAMGAGGLDVGSYRLVAQYPRRILDPPAEVGAGPALTDLGFGAGQEMFLLEVLEQEGNARLSSTEGMVQRPNQSSLN